MKAPSGKMGEPGDRGDKGECRSVDRGGLVELLARLSGEVGRATGAAFLGGSVKLCDSR